MFKILIIFLTVFNFNISYASDVESSWNKAVVFVPESSNPIGINDINSNKTYPVILYLHGCTGIVDWHDHDWGSTLSKNGYIVILLDSMARPSRIPNCDPIRKTGGLFPQAHEYRQQEISYALSQLKNKSWAKQDRIFLMGHSEGGTAVAISQHQEFRANIILAWTCTFQFEPALDGIKSPKHIPILAVAAKNDEWRVGKRTYGRCSDRSEGRNLTQIDLNGSIHATTKYPESKPAVLEFLKKSDSQ